MCYINPYQLLASGTERVHTTGMQICCAIAREKYLIVDLQLQVYRLGNHNIYIVFYIYILLLGARLLKELSVERIQLSNPTFIITTIPIKTALKMATSAHFCFDLSTLMHLPDSD